VQTGKTNLFIFHMYHRTAVLPNKREFIVILQDKHKAGGVTLFIFLTQGEVIAKNNPFILYIGGK